MKRRHRGLVLVLTFSACLRIVLIWNGGQTFWPEESRYVFSLKDLIVLASDRPGAALEFLVLSTPYPLFPMVALPPAVLHSSVIVLAGWPLFDYRISTLALTSFSFFVIGLAYALVVKAGADHEELCSQLCSPPARRPCSTSADIWYGNQNTSDSIRLSGRE
jgi:hypothetical protein